MASLQRSATRSEEESVRTRPDRVLVVGAARSGTSWLIRALAAAPNTKYYYEPDNIDADPTNTRPVGRSGFGPYPILKPGDDGGGYRAIWDAAFAGRLPDFGQDTGLKLTVARTALKVPNSVRDPLTRLAAKGLTMLPATVDRVAIKTIYALFSLDWLIENYHPSVLVIQRNPLNVISSWRELKIPGFDLTTRPQILSEYRDRFKGDPPGQDASELTKIAWQVGLLTTAIGDALDRYPDWLLADHEDLCIEPERKMKALAERMNIPWTEQSEAFLNESNRPGEGLKPVRVTAEQPFRWKKRLSDDEVTEITEVLERFPRHGWIRQPD